ncbi:hypothetical protein GSS88_09195 [Corynebacterium sp. 3HC-13]|nr:ParA family protein [Corynebacterium poyangense]MBZ8177960.1 hypothetical protein [Corynebacterium poyangense]
MDTPPGSPREIQSALDVADFIIIPTSPKPQDVARIIPTLDAIGDKPVGVLLTHVGFNSKLYIEARETIENWGVETFRSCIPEKVDIARGYGRVLQKLYGYDDVLSEIVNAFGDEDEL